MRRCHEKSSSFRCVFVFTLLLGLILAGIAPAQTTSQTPPADKIPPPAVPPKSLAPRTWNVVGDQEKDGSINRVHHPRDGGQAEIESSKYLFRADEIEYDEDTGDVRAEGRVYFRDFDKNEQLWCNRLDYNTDEETGKFYDVRGETMPRIVARVGVLTGSSPFHFEGEWAERQGEKYILYNGWITNCKMPDPWWRMRGKRFVIVPEDHATTHQSWFILRRFPLFYTPFFYHSLEKHPRKSGFLLPSIVPHSIRGSMVGIGYYWAMNRSTDLSYRFDDYTTQAFKHNLDFRAKPREGTEFGAILYAVQDRGSPGYTDPLNTYSGVDLYGAGRSELGNGWSARGFFTYLSSFRFRQEWSQSYTEAIGSEIHSVGAITKDWSSYSFNGVFAHLQNFLSTEIPITDPDGSIRFLSNSVSIRKLPEAELTGRDRQLFPNLPLWFSFDSAAGLLYRSDPIFDPNNKQAYNFQTGNFTNRVNLAPHLTTALHLGDFHIVPSIGFQETFYGESQTQIQSSTPLQYINLGEPINQLVGTNIVRSAREFNLDLIFPSFARVFNKKTVFGDKLKHVIEPRATYHYVTGIGDDFNQVIRFDEMDLLSNTNELELSLANRIYAKRGDTVQEIFTWELMQKRYFDPTFGGALTSGERNVFASTADISAYAFLVGPRSSSPVVSLLRASPVANLGIQWQADYDPRYSRIVDSDFSVDYRWAGKYHISAGHDAVRVPYTVWLNGTTVSPNANQFRTRFDYGDANRRGMNAGVETVYDYRQAVLRYITAQVTYNTDCCGLSVQYREYNTGIGNIPQLRIAFSIANLGTFGTLRKQDRLF